MDEIWVVEVKAILQWQYIGAYPNRRDANAVVINSHERAKQTGAPLYDFRVRRFVAAPVTEKEKE